MTTKEGKKVTGSPGLARRCDQIKELRRKIDAHDVKIAPVRKQLGILEEKLLEAMLQSRTEAVKGKLGHASVVRTLVPNIEDQQAFEKYVAKKKAFDLYQRRLNSQAWRDRIDAGEKVPGVKGFQRVSLRVT